MNEFLVGDFDRACQAAAHDAEALAREFVMEGDAVDTALKDAALITVESNDDLRELGITARMILDRLTALPND